MSRLKTERVLNVNGFLLPCSIQEILDLPQDIRSFLLGTLRSLTGARDLQKKMA